MDKEEQKRTKKIIILLVVLITATIALFLLKNYMDKDNKILNAKDYIIEKETEYSKDETKGLLPLINLKGNEIEKINNEILGLYYGIAYKEYDIFKYEYNLHDDILSLLITITIVDDSEYGKIEYHSYNINVKDNKVLNNNELIESLDISNVKLKNEIENRLKKYYSMDSLNSNNSYEEYKETLGYDFKNVYLYINENKLYAYITLGLTPGLLEYEGNINEILISEI